MMSLPQQGKGSRDLKREMIVMGKNTGNNESRQSEQSIIYCQGLVFGILWST